MWQIHCCGSGGGGACRRCPLPILLPGLVVVVRDIVWDRLGYVVVALTLQLLS